MTPNEKQRKAALEIIHKIKLAKSSQAKIAKLNNVKPAAVWNVIWSRSESRPIKRTISKVTGVRIEDLWPDPDEDNGDERRAA